MQTDNKPDQIFAHPQDMIVNFEFDENVAAVFSDMIRRSVPGYGTLVTLIGLLAEQYAQDNSTIYDLGCSLGATTLSMLHRIHCNHCQIIAVDNSQAMVERCKKNVVGVNNDVSVEVVCADIQDIIVKNASVVVINLTLQFIDPALRQTLINHIYEGLLPGGVLLLSEKIKFEALTEHTFQESMHIAFKKANAYSDLEISQKRTALENVLIPDDVQIHINRLKTAGFQSIHQWFQCFNFVSFLAIKR